MYSWMMIIIIIVYLLFGPISENTKSNRLSDVYVRCHYLLYDRQHLFQLQLDSLDLDICAKLLALLFPMDGYKVEIIIC